MKKYIICFLIVTILIPSYAFDYLWPVDISRKLSATFGEFRTGHYHSGIDIKTNHTIHHPVYAISDGYVWRLVETYSGYGKAIYIKMKDGNFAVYAHLDDFPPKIEKFARQEQNRVGRYKINAYFKPNQIPVQKGELIAYTGRTGTVHPHLHFEIRTPDHKPFNPLHTNLKKSDQTPPVIKGLTLTPLSRQSRINYTPEHQSYSTYSAQGSYRISTHPIPLQGPFGIEIKTYDRVRGLYNKYGPYSIEMYVDNSLAFHIRCDTLTFQDTHLINFDRNSQLMQNGKGRYIRLWRFLRDRDFPFYNGEHSGEIDLAPGIHDIKILVKDFNANTSRVEFQVQQTQNHFPRVEKFDIKNDTLEITLCRDSTHYFYRKIAGELHYSNAPNKAVALQDFRVMDKGYYFKVPFSDNTTALSLKSYPFDQSNSQKIYIPCNRSAELTAKDIQYELIQNPESFLIKFDFDQIPDSIPELYLQSSDQLRPIPLISQSPNIFLTQAIDYNIWDAAFAMEIRVADKIVLRQKLNLTHITQNQAFNIISPDSAFSFHLKKGSVQRDVVVSLTKSKAPEDSDNNILSPIYELQPTSLNLLQSGHIDFHYDTTISNLSKVGIYTIYNDKYYYLNSNINTLKKCFTTSAKAGQFCLLEDTQPPEITILTPRNGATYSKSHLNYISARIEDKLSGIKDDMSISLNIDGKEVIAEYNVATDKIRYKPENIKVGKHTYKLSVTDKMGNTSSRTGYFYIK